LAARSIYRWTSASSDARCPRPSPPVVVHLRRRDVSIGSSNLCTFRIGRHRSSRNVAVVASAERGVNMRVCLWRALAGASIRCRPFLRPKIGRRHRVVGSPPPSLSKPLVHAYVTGHGVACQISAAYSLMVRSLEKRPEHATFMIAFWVQPSGFAYSAATRPCVSTYALRSAKCI